MTSDQYFDKILVELSRRGYAATKISRSAYKPRWMIRFAGYVGILIGDKGNAWTIELDHGDDHDWVYGVTLTDSEYVSVDDQTDIIKEVVDAVDRVYYGTMSEVFTMMKKLSSRHHAQFAISNNIYGDDPSKHEVHARTVRRMKEEYTRFHDYFKDLKKMRA